MIKNFKLFEANERNEELFNEFLKDYNDFYKNQPFPNSYYKGNKNKAIRYNIPDIFFDDYLILEYYYKLYSNWQPEEKQVVKKILKKYVMNSVLQKFEKEPSLYIELKSMIDKRKNFNNTGSFDNISDASMKYTYLLFNTAIRNAPKWIVDANDKYNL
jgi:hypothetical protein